MGLFGVVWMPNLLPPPDQIWTTYGVCREPRADRGRKYVKLCHQCCEEKEAFEVIMSSLKKLIQRERDSSNQLIWHTCLYNNKSVIKLSSDLTLDLNTARKSLITPLLGQYNFLHFHSFSWSLTTWRHEVATHDPCTFRSETHPLSHHQGNRRHGKWTVKFSASHV